MEPETINLDPLAPVDPGPEQPTRQPTIEAQRQQPWPPKDYLRRLYQYIFFDNQDDDDVLVKHLYDAIDQAKRSKHSLQAATNVTSDPGQLDLKVLERLHSDYGHFRSRSDSKLFRQLLWYQAFAPPLIRCWRQECTNSSVLHCWQ